MEWTAGLSLLNCFASYCWVISFSSFSRYHWPFKIGSVMPSMVQGQTPGFPLRQPATPWMRVGFLSLLCVTGSTCFETLLIPVLCLSLMESYSFSKSCGEVKVLWFKINITTLENFFFNLYSTCTLFTISKNPKMIKKNCYWHIGLHLKKFQTKLL